MTRGRSRTVDSVKRTSSFLDEESSTPWNAYRELDGTRAAAAKILLAVREYLVKVS